MNKSKRLILGEGEGRDANGEIKKHVLDCVASDILFEHDDRGISFTLKADAQLTHDEHAMMIFPKGNYRSYNQVEYNPFSQEVQRVFD